MKTINRAQPPVRSAVEERGPAAKGAVPTHEAIAWKAYLLWEARGCPQGTHMQDWLDAEKQLKTEQPK